LWFERNRAKDHEDTAKPQKCIIIMQSRFVNKIGLFAAPNKNGLPAAPNRQTSQRNVGAWME